MKNNNEILYIIEMDIELCRNEHLVWNIRKNIINIIKMLFKKYDLIFDLSEVIIGPWNFRISNMYIATRVIREIVPRVDEWILTSA